MSRSSAFILAAIIIASTGLHTLGLASTGKTGFLVVAPDRGFLGNQEIRMLVDEFQKSYPAALGLVGRSYTGVEGEYAVYLSRAAQELKQAGATEIVAIPLFLSEADPLLTRVKPLLPVYTGGVSVRWAPAMAHDYLTGQIILDRVEALSQHPESERLILVGTGATNEASDKALKADIEKLLAYVNRYKHFAEAESVVYYDRDAEGADKKNREIKARLMAQGAKQGRTLVVPAFIGPKFDHGMSMTNWLDIQFKNTQLVYKPAELLPHPNALLWLKKTANRHTQVDTGAIGVVIMPHGSTQPWNDAVEATIRPLLAKYPIEMAYGMGDPAIIQDAVFRLENRGIRRIVFVRMYALDHQMKPMTDYILGLTESPMLPGGRGGHDHELSAPPAQIRSAALFSTFGGYEEHPAIAQVIHERIMEISKEPDQETVILLAHGAQDDEDNAKWVSVMNANLERVKKDPHCAKLKAIKAATVREDWPEVRERAVAEVRRMVQDHSNAGRVLVIANRLYGSGPYKIMLKDLNYALNERGLVHPVITSWLEEGIARAATALTGPVLVSQEMSRQ